MFLCARRPGLPTRCVMPESRCAGAHTQNPLCSGEGPLKYFHSLPRASLLRNHALRSACRAFYITGLLGCAVHGLAQSSPAPATTATLVEQAFKMTAQNRLQEAESTYRQLLETDPDEGLPLLARFLHRTGRTTDALSLLETSPASTAPPLLRARTAIAAGSPEKAVEILRGSPSPDGDLYRRTVLLANSLQMLKRPEEAAEAIEQAVMLPGLAAVDRRDLFQKLALVGGPSHLRSALPVIVRELVTSSSLPYPTLRTIAVDGMIVISSSPEYADFHRDLEAGHAGSPAIAWLYALSLVRKGDAPSARQVLDSFTTASLTPSEKRVLFEELARMTAENPQRAISLYEEIIPLAPDSDRIRLTVAQLAFREKNYAKAAELLTGVDSANLDEGQLGLYKNVLLASLAHPYPESPLVDVFAREAEGLTWHRVRELAQAPFVTLSSDAYEALDKELRTALQASTAPAELHVLRLSLANATNDGSGLLDALGAYVEARPEVIDAAQEYADAAAQQAWFIMTADSQTSPPAEVMKQVGDTAAEALWRVVAVKPYIPEPYMKLIELYQLYGEPEKARRVPLALADRTSATAEEIHLAAYVSAQADMPQESIPLYERALKMSPNDTRFRLNYAGALTRVNRHKEADAIYRDVIERGVFGKQYHAHEVYANSIRNATAFGYKDDLLKFLRGLIPRKDVPQHDYYLMEMGKVLLGLEMPNEAIAFFQAVHDMYPEHAYQASDFLVQAHVAMGKFAEAEQMLARQEKESTDTASLLLVRSNYAATKAAQGKIAEAVAEYKRLAEKYPQERQAIRGLVTAANSLVKEGRFRAATELLHQYLSLDAGDPDGEASARELLARIENKDFPSDILVKSALEDTAPPL